MKITNKYITLVLAIGTIVIAGLVMQKYTKEQIRYTYRATPISTEKVLAFLDQDYNSSKKYVIIFFDYNCPYCAIFDDNIQAISQDNDISLIYFPRPLDPVSYNAALAMECAKTQNNFSVFHTYLKRNNHKLHNINFLNIGQEIGIKNSAEYKECYLGRKLEPVLEKKVNLADSLTIEVVPSYIINNMLIEGIMTKNQLIEKLRV